MNDFFKNDFTKAFGIDQVLALQSELVKQVTESNKRLALETLKNTKTVVDTFARNIDNEIRRLDSGV